jgi:prefoldin subunit 5
MKNLDKISSERTSVREELESVFETVDNEINKADSTGESIKILKKHKNNLNSYLKNTFKKIKETTQIISRLDNF